MQTTLLNNRYNAKTLSLVLIVFFTSIIAQYSYAQTNNDQDIINIVFTSDAHYGISRPKFRGDSNVAGYIVNHAMIGQINTLPTLTLPADGGVLAAKPLAAVDYLIQTGDIANRMEVPIQSAAKSWSQFELDYIQSVSLKDHNGKPAGLLVAPGNHDISNAIGFYKPMLPLTDPTSMVKIYNMMLKPAIPLTNATYNYATDKVNYSRNIKGIHLMFITLWPDSAERIWMQKDLDTVKSSTPVIIFTHDQPTCEAKHFTNPVPPHTINAGYKFENLTAEYYKDKITVKGEGEKASTDIEQRGWVSFLKKHQNIKAYFHGNSNYNEFYVYHGPDNDVNLNTFRVDSPMKGKYSSQDETLLSFQLISFDASQQTLTVRECLWNTRPQNPTQPIVWGKSITVSLKVE